LKKDTGYSFAKTTDTILLLKAIYLTQLPAWMYSKSLIIRQSQIQLPQIALQSMAAY